MQPRLKGSNIQESNNNCNLQNSFFATKANKKSTTTKNQKVVADGNNAADAGCNICERESVGGV